jgi:hypothetical protein
MRVPTIVGFSEGEKMNLKNVVLYALLLLSSNITLADSDREQGDRQRGGGQISFPNQQPSWPSSSAPANVELQVGNYFNGMAQLDLLKDYYTANQLQGQIIKDITIFAATERGQGTAALLLNGQQLEREQVVSQRVGSYTFKVDQFGNSVGRNLRTISLNMRGNFFIEKVVFNLVQTNSTGDSRRDPFPTPAPRNEIVTQKVNQRIMEEGGVELFRLFGLGLSRQGQIVKRITLTANSARGMGMAELLVNGKAIGMQQRLSEMTNTVSFDLAPGSRIGQALLALQIHVRGMVNIEAVSIEFESQMSGPSLPDRNQRRFEQVINQRLYDSNGIEVSKLAMIPAQLDGRIVDSVELNIRNADMGTKLSLCQIQSGQFQRVECGMQTFVSQGRQTVRLMPQGIVKVHDLSLAVRMGMIDLDSIVINFR